MNRKNIIIAIFFVLAFAAMAFLLINYSNEQAKEAELERKRAEEIENANIEAQNKIEDIVFKVGKIYGIEDCVFSSYDEGNYSFYVKFSSEDFEKLSNHDKANMIYKIESEVNELSFPEKSVYYDEGIDIKISGYWIDRQKGELVLIEGRQQIYSEELPGYTGSSSSSSRQKCSSCGGSGKKLVEFYEYGDWGEITYSSYTCTSCNGTGYK